MNIIEEKIANILESQAEQGMCATIALNALEAGNITLAKQMLESIKLTAAKSRFQLREVKKVVRS